MEHELKTVLRGCTPKQHQGSEDDLKLRFVRICATVRLGNYNITAMKSSVAQVTLSTSGTSSTPDMALFDALSNALKAHEDSTHLLDALLLLIERAQKNPDAISIFELQDGNGRTLACQTAFSAKKLLAKALLQETQNQGARTADRFGYCALDYLQMTHPEDVLRSELDAETYFKFSTTAHGSHQETVVLAAKEFPVVIHKANSL